METGNYRQQTVRGRHIALLMNYFPNRPRYISSKYIVIITNTFVYSLASDVIIVSVCILMARLLNGCRWNPFSSIFLVESPLGVADRTSVLKLGKLRIFKVGR